jgi:transposase
MSASGNREQMGRICKGGDRYLRTLLFQRARAMVGAINETRYANSFWPLRWRDDLRLLLLRTEETD